MAKLESTIKAVRIENSRIEWLEKNDINFSKLVRRLIDAEIDRRDSIRDYDEGEPTDDPLDAVVSDYGEEEVNMVSFCVRLKEKLGYEFIGQIDAMVDGGMIKVIDTTKSQILPAGEMTAGMSDD